MKLLAELLQEKLGEDKQKVYVHIDEYMEYANKQKQRYENEDNAWDVLEEELAELLNCKVKVGVPDETRLFAQFNIVNTAIISSVAIYIKFSDYTFKVRKQSTNWLLDCLKENSNELN